MKINQIFIETKVRNNERARQIIARYPNIEVQEISKIENYFGRVKKPYLHKHSGFNLFIGNKKGKTVKETPDAYGLNSGRHFYFIYAYNCIYECQYCYLQGYFNSPDLVLFINYEDVIAEMQTVHDNIADEQVWFHAGEYSDSLALSHLTNEWPLFFKFFQKNPRAYLELRTKSTNIKTILDLEPLNNVIVSFSISPQKQISKYDLKTPSLEARIKAMKRLEQRGFRLALHLDPIIYDEKFETLYREMTKTVFESIAEESIDYVSVGALRFSKDVYRAVQKHYTRSDLHVAEFITGYDGKVRYLRPIRKQVLSSTKNLLINAGVQSKKIYFCMDE